MVIWDSPDLCGLESSKQNYFSVQIVLCLSTYLIDSIYCSIPKQVLGMDYKAYSQTLFSMSVKICFLHPDRYGCEDMASLPQHNLSREQHSTHTTNFLTA